MADVKPPRLADDERATLLALLEYQRTSLVRKLDGLADDDAARSPLPTGTSLRWLVEHVARAASTWVEERFAGRPPHDDGDARTLPEAIDAYRATWARVDEVVAGAELDDLCVADVASPPVNLRWVLAHLLEETARHAGHADVLRELVDGTTGR